MARLEKVTFEISTDAMRLLRRLKIDLEENGLPIKQRQIVEFLLLSAELQPLLKHFKNASDRRIGMDVTELRQQRKLAYAKSKTRKTTATSRTVRKKR